MELGSSSALLEQDVAGTGRRYCEMWFLPRLLSSHEPAGGFSLSPLLIWTQTKKVAQCYEKPASIAILRTSYCHVHEGESVV
jgi:hypothetical protein